MKSIRCGRGLGDSIYLQSVVRHMLASGGLRMQVKSDYPDVFRPLGDRVEVVPFDRRVDIVAHYSVRKGIDGTTQFKDCCLAAGIHEPVDLRMDWEITDQSIVDAVRADGRPVLIVQLPRTPMARTDGFGASLLPDCKAIQKVIDLARESYTIVQVGAGVPLHRFKGIDIDLANQTTVAQMIDVASVADRCLGYCSFLVPLAESMNKSAMFVWSSRGLRDGQLFVRRITPAKVLHKSSSRYVIDNATDQQILGVWHALH